MVYFITDGEYFKVGKSNNVDRRLCELQTSNHKTLEVYKTVKGGKNVEKFFHCMFREKRVTGEWFALDTVEIDKGLEMYFLLSEILIKRAEGVVIENKGVAIYPNMDYRIGKRKCGDCDFEKSQKERCFSSHEVSEIKEPLDIFSIIQCDQVEVKDSFQLCRQQCKSIGLTERVFKEHLKNLEPHDFLMHI